LKKKNKSFSIKKNIYVGGDSGLITYIAYLTLVGILPRNYFGTTISAPFYIIISPIEKIGVKLFGQNPLPIFMLLAVWWIFLGALVSVSISFFKRGT
jgi:hypothetical protein